MIREEIEKTTLWISRRELAVVQLIAQGKTSIEIGTELGITPKTVETHRSKVLKRLHCPNTPNLIHVLHQEKLLS